MGIQHTSIGVPDLGRAQFYSMCPLLVLMPLVEFFNGVPFKIEIVFFVISEASRLLGGSTIFGTVCYTGLGVLRAGDVWDNGDIKDTKHWG